MAYPIHHMTTQANTTTAHNLSRLTLKSFKTVKFMSEETTCFTAVVCIDGKAIGEASNEGHGGCTFIHYVNDAARVTAEAFAKSISPTDVEGWDFLADKGFTFDNLIDIAVELRDRADAQKKRVAKIRKDAVKSVWFLTDKVGKGSYRSINGVNDLNRLKAIDVARKVEGFTVLIADMTDAEIIAHFSI